MELGVGSVPGEQIVVGAHLDDPRAAQDDDQVGHAHRAEAVGYLDGDPAVGGAV